MSELFGGVENFTPAFTGRQLAIAAGGGAASAFTSGMNAGTNKKQQGLSQQKFDFQTGRQATMMLKQMEALNAWGNDFSSYIHE